MAAGDVSKQILAMVRFRIGEPSADRWQDSEIYSYINDGQMAIASEEAPDVVLLPLTEIRNATFASGTFSYNLPVDFLRERYVTLGGILCKRMELLNLQARKSNIYFQPSKSNPFYSIVQGQIVFHTESQNPDSLVYQVHYVRKPMRVRAVTSLVAAGTVLTTSSVHGLTTVANANDPLTIEDMTTTAGSPNAQWTLQSVTNTTQLVIDSGTAAGTGGRVVHMLAGQIAADEDPLVGPVFHGILADWAVARCREQALERAEADRQFAHLRQRIEIMKSRCGGGRRFDGVAGDPGRRQAG